MMRRLGIGLLACGLVGAGWPPPKPDEALPIVEKVLAAVDDTASCDAISRVLEDGTRAQQLPLLEANTRIHATDTPLTLKQEARVRAIEKRFVELDKRCAHDPGYYSIRRWIAPQGFPNFNDPNPTLPGPNRQACFRYVSHWNALPCNPSSLDREQMCPLAFDDLPLDMVPMYNCLITESYCRDQLFEAKGMSRCNDLVQQR